MTISSKPIYSPLEGVEVLAPIQSNAEYLPLSNTTQADILTKSSLSFIVLLHRTFNETRKQLLANREIFQSKLNAGTAKLEFLKDEVSQKLQQDPTWQGALPSYGLIDRRTEITGPPERKMIINALNTPVKTYMSDFEDSSSPTWSNVLNGQLNLYDAIRHQVDFKNLDNNKDYKVNYDSGKPLPTIIVRPRGWHMVEKHILVDGEPISASIVDFGLYFYHNAKELINQGYGPYFYLPKMEHHLEAKLWNDIFNVSQDIFSIKRGTIRATVLIETLPAAYQMEEIIYQLRNHTSGLNCGRWDYIFSTIKTLVKDQTKLLPNRDQITMTVPFMSSYCKRLIHICHNRQVHAMGGMAAQIPIKNDEVANTVAMDKVFNDKLREVKMGYDGTWVAHPALSVIANGVFNQHMPTPNQLFKSNEDPHVTEQDLSNTAIENGVITTDGIRQNIYIALCYVESWIRGIGCVPINNLMEDAATAEVSRLQLYSWRYHNVELDDLKVKLSSSIVEQLLQEELDKLLIQFPSSKNYKFEIAARYLKPEMTGKSCSNFLTTLIYDEIVEAGQPIDLNLLK
ncbi:malate synthase 1, glyoxysomal [Scheffersomyces coipomensis]|uniref:malate synthase 1, glyoxysomal n=1 Tax=Scheffersomyces coipomensis TaxID=1788519 RepID=UPI00315DF603